MTDDTPRGRVTRRPYASRTAVAPRPDVERVVLYARQSVTRDEASISIEAQFDAIRTFAREHGYTIAQRRNCAVYALAMSAMMAPRTPSSTSFTVPPASVATTAPTTAAGCP